jgi:magnesium transporter
MIKGKIDSFHLEDIKNDDHPSVFFEHEDYDLFILRIPQMQGDTIVFLSKAFVITDNKYYHYEKESGMFVDLINMKGFYKCLDKYIDNTLKIISNHFNEIEIIEDTFYEGKSIKDFNQQWFIFKNNFVRINRVLFKAVEVIADLIENYKKEDDYLERNFEDIQEHLQRAHRNSGLLLEKLDAIHNFHLTQNNEQMNKTIYILTLLSAIFLPLNLIVGFFGMNTTSLPFTINAGGTYNVILLLSTAGIVAALVTLIFKNKYK